MSPDVDNYPLKGKTAPVEDHNHRVLRLKNNTNRKKKSRFFFLIHKEERAEPANWEETIKRGEVELSLLSQSENMIHQLRQKRLISMELILITFIQLIIDFWVPLCPRVRGESEHKSESDTTPADNSNTRCQGLR